MSAACPVIDDAAFLDSALRFVDCAAQTLGSGGYQALAESGSVISVLLAGILTIFIAIVGYRLLVGEVLDIRDGVVAVVKIGIILALATSWPAYRTLVYNVVLHGPAELVSEIGRGGNLPGSAGGMVARLDQIDRGLLALGDLGTGSINQTTRIREIDGKRVTAVERTSEPPSIFSAFALGTARIIFLTATIGAFASVRLVAGILLALTPFFAALLLFAGTRSIFEGWLKSLVAAALGAVAVTIILSVELALLEPWLFNLLALRQAQLPVGGAATELLVVSLAFGLALLAGLGMAARLTIGFRLPDGLRPVVTRIGESASTLGSAGAGRRAQHEVPADQLTRAAAVANAVAEIQRREAAHQARSLSASLMTAGKANAQASSTSPLGASYRRRSQMRVSGSAQRRDNSV